jgi:hypothetical protein
MMGKGSHIMLLQAVLIRRHVLITWMTPDMEIYILVQQGTNCDVILRPTKEKMDIANILGSLTTRMIGELRKFLQSTFWFFKYGFGKFRCGKRMVW